MREKKIDYLIDISLTVFLTSILSFELVVNPSIYIWEVLNKVKDIIWTIFVLDYIRRFVLARRKLVFMREEILDLISLIPPSIYWIIISKLNIINVFDIFMLYKICKFIWLLILILKLKNKISTSLIISKFFYMILLTLISIIVGAIAISIVEGISFGDAVWWSFVTFTTVGYGDIVLKTNLGRGIAVILMILGIGFIGVTTSTIAGYIIGGRRIEKDSVKRQIIYDMKRMLDDYDNLSDKDIDDIYKILKELKK